MIDYPRRNRFKQGPPLRHRLFIRPAWGWPDHVKWGLHRLWPIRSVQATCGDFKRANMACSEQGVGFAGGGDKR